MTDFAPDARQRALLALVEPLAHDFAARAAAHDRDGSFPFENFEALRAANLHALTVPTAYGGLGAGELDYTLVLERVAWGDAATALVLGMHCANMGILVEGQLWPDRLPALCQAVVSEGALINAAQAEPEMGSPSHGGLPATTAQRDEAGEWRISGRKIYTTGAPILRYFIVLAALEEPDQPVRLGTFLVPRDAPGVRIEETWDALALRASGSHDLVLDGARLPATALLDTRPPGAPDPRGALGLPWSTLTLGAIYTGVAQAALDEAAHFAATRIPTGLGKPIGELPAVRVKLGRMAALLLTSHRLLRGLAADWVHYPERRPALREEMGLVKAITTNNAVEVTDLALRIAGGAGLQQTSRLQRLLRDARAGLVNAPLEDVVWENAGRAVVRRASEL